MFVLTHSFLPCYQSPGRVLLYFFLGLCFREYPKIIQCFNEQHWGVEPLEANRSTVALLQITLWINVVLCHLLLPLFYNFSGGFCFHLKLLVKIVCILNQLTRFIIWSIQVCQVPILKKLTT